MIYMSLAITNNTAAKIQSGIYENALKQKGYEVFNPVKEFANSELTEKQIMLKELEILSECSMMVLLPNNYKSKGVKVEIAWCEKFNIPIKRALIGKNKLNIYSFDYNNFNVDENLKIWIKEVAKEIDLPFEEFLISRKGEIVLTRHIIAYILKFKGFDYRIISELLFKERTTILHSVALITNFITNDKPTQLIFDKLINSYNVFVDCHNIKIKEVA